MQKKQYAGGPDKKTARQVNNCSCEERGKVAKEASKMHSKAIFHTAREATRKSSWRFGPEWQTGQPGTGADKKAQGSREWQRKAQEARENAGARTRKTMVRLEKRRGKRSAMGAWRANWGRCESGCGHHGIYRHSHRLV